MKRFQYIYILLALVVLIQSCRKDSEIDLHYAIPAPSEIKIAAIEARKVTIEWAYDYKEATEVQVELSTSATFATNGLVKQLTLDPGTLSASFDSLASLATYYVRVGASNGDPLYSSAYSVFSFQSAEIESIFNAVSRKDVTASSALLTWNAPKTGTVTHIEVAPEGSQAWTKIQLSAADISARQVLLPGLQPATSYKAIIYQGEENKGEMLFATLDPNAAITINGSDIIYETLQEAIDASESGDILNIGSAKYDFSEGETISIANKSLTLKAVKGAVIPEIKSKIINLSGSVRYLKLTGIKFIGTSAQAIGLDGLTSAVEIEVTDCDFSGPTAGFIYASTSVPASAAVSLTVNNTLFHDFGATGGDFIDFRGGTVTKISVKNSSFWNLARAFLRIDASANSSSSQPLLFENCTFNNFSNGGKFVYVRSAGAKTTFNKCIITNMVSNQDNGVSGTGTSLTFNQCVISGSNSAKIKSVGKNTETTDADPQYAKASEGDFTVGNPVVKAAGQGDERWLK